MGRKYLDRGVLLPLAALYILFLRGFTLETRTPRVTI